MSLSILIPCRNEEKIIKKTVKKIIKKLNKIDFELVLIDDYSNDYTYSIFKNFKSKKIKFYKNKIKGLGGAISLGIQKSKKKFICIYMADMSDDINDLIKYYNTIKKNNYDAVLGSRFQKSSKVYNYPFFKFLLNRLFNIATKIIFFSNYNDFTNAFKIYKKKTLTELLPLISENFNVFLEIPLKIISRGYKYKIIPINWHNRKLGYSKFKVKELGSKYLFTLIYCFLEKILLNKKI